MNVLKITINLRLSRDDVHSRGRFRDWRYNLVRRQEYLREYCQLMTNKPIDILIKNWKDLGFFCR